MKLSLPKLVGLLVLGGVGAILVGVGLAEPSSTNTARSWDQTRSWILHQKLPAAGGQHRIAHEFVYDPVAGATIPRRFIRDGRTHQAPKTVAQPAAGEPLHTHRGLTASRPATSPLEGPKAGLSDHPQVIDPRRSFTMSALPDRRTESERRLQYRAIFDPSIVPFKRNHALNTVDDDYRLRLHQGHIRQLKVVGNRVEPGREVFWGSVLVQGEADALVPLPSVSPDSQVLSFSTTPQTEVTFHKDRADNLYVRPTRAGTFRLVFVTDASSGYFGRPLPTDGRIKDIPRSLVGAIPPSVRRKGRRFAKQLHIGRSMQLSKALKRLTRYFRGFTPGQAPQTTGDIYLDLANGKKGICRHRSFAFVVTALALGIPARYVANEAHVFVEVWLPGGDAGWMRIDLGGSADELVVHNAQDKSRHMQQAFDPFDRPEGFAEQVTGGQLAGARTVRGLPSSRPRAKAKPSPSPSRKRRSRVEGALSARITIPVAASGDAPTETTLKISKSILFRGDPMKLSGRVTSGGEGLKFGIVQFLLLEGGTRKPIALLGLAPIDPSDGRFEAEVRLTKRQPPGNYEIAAQFLGSPGFAPSMSP